MRIIALSPNAKDMAENMYRALWSWIICVVVTVVVSYMTKPLRDDQMVGLVYGCTEIPSEGHLPLYQRPIFWAIVTAICFVILNILSGKQHMPEPKRVISIWFFIGSLLLFYGLLITAAGLYELVSPPPRKIVLSELHASVW